MKQVVFFCLFFFAFDGFQAIVENECFKLLCKSHSTGSERHTILIYWMSFVFVWSTKNKNWHLLVHLASTKPDTSPLKKKRKFDCLNAFNMATSDFSVFPGRILCVRSPHRKNMNATLMLDV